MRELGKGASSSTELVEEYPKPLSDRDNTAAGKSRHKSAVVPARARPLRGKESKRGRRAKCNCFDLCWGGIWHSLTFSS
jgi:hypothetical protein